VLRRHRALGPVALITTIVLGSSLATVPTPLYPLYESSLGISSLGVTAVFAAFAAGAIAGLAASALLSARLSRRTVYIAASLLQIAAALVLAANLGFGGFIAGRIITGLGAGLLAASGTAFVLELTTHAAPPASAALTILAPASAYIGLGIGPVIGGFSPVQSISEVPLVFLGIAGGVAVSLAGSLIFLPSSTGTTRAYAGSLSPLPFKAALGAFAAFMTTGLFGSATSVLLNRLNVPSAAFTGAVAALVFFSGVPGIAILARRLNTSVIAVVLAVGLLGVAGSLNLGSLALLIICAIVAGTAGGALFSRSLGAALAVPNQSAFQQTSLVFGFAYLGLAVPVLGLGVSLVMLPVELTIWGFAALAAALCLVVAVRAEPA
jgi:hypothetical protein